MKKLFLLVAILTSICGKSQSIDSSNTKKDSTTTLSVVEITGIRADFKTPISQKTLTNSDIREGYFGQDAQIIIGGTPSVTYYSDGGSYSGYMYMRLRGIDQSRINFTLNGVPLNEPEDMGCYFSNYTDFMSNVGSMQVQRGVGTSTNGTSSFAGSVNFESPNLSDTAYSIVQTGYGSYNSSRLSAAFNTGVSKNGVSLYGRFSNNITDGYRYHSGTDASSFFLSGGHSGKNGILKFTAFSGLSKNQMAYLACSESDIKIDPKTNYLSKDENDEFRQNFAMVQHTKFIGDNLYLTNTLYYTGLSGNYDVYFSTDMLSFSLFSDMYGAISNFAYYGNWLKFNTGIHANAYYRNHSMSIKPMTSQKLYSNRGDKNEASSFVKISCELKNFILFGDIQARTVSFEYSPYIHSGINNSSVSWLFINSRAGITYSKNNNVSFYASVGNTHREPTRNDMFAGFDDIDTSNIQFIGDLSRVKPEGVIDYETGVNYKNEKISVQANVFRMDFKNEIAAIGQLSYIGLPLRKNVSSSYRTGVEADYSYGIGKFFALSGNATIMKARIKSYTTDYDSITYENVSPLLTPWLIINQGVGFKNKRVSSYVGCSYVGQSYLDNTTNDTLMISNGPAVFNFNLSYKITGNFSVSIAINNITDVLAYNGGYASAGTRYYYVAAGRNFYATLNAKF